MPTDRTPEPPEIPMKAPDEPVGWAYKKKNVKLICYALYVISGILLLIDPFVHKHGKFAIEHWWGFYGIYGFVGCVFLVLAAKELRKMVMRDEGYYDR